MDCIMPIDNGIYCNSGYGNIEDNKMVEAILGCMAYLALMCFIGMFGLFIYDIYRQIKKGGDYDKQARYQDRHSAASGDPDIAEWNFKKGKGKTKWQIQH